MKKLVSNTKFGGFWGGYVCTNMSEVAISGKKNNLDCGTRFLLYILEPKAERKVPFIPLHTHIHTRDFQKKKTDNKI